MNDLTKGLLIGLAVSTAYFGAEFASQQAKIEKLKREERVSCPIGSSFSTWQRARSDD